MKDIKIGRVSFSPSWSKLTFEVFKKEYQPFKTLAGKTEKEAARILGIAVPKKKKTDKEEGGE